MSASSAQDVFESKVLSALASGVVVKTDSVESRIRELARILGIAHGAKPHDTVRFHFQMCRPHSSDPLHEVIVELGEVEVAREGGETEAQALNAIELELQDRCERLAAALRGPEVDE